MIRDFVIGPYYPQQSFLKSNMYKQLRQAAVNYATKINREVAEGPSHLVVNNFYGPVELWPLVCELS